MKDFIADFSTRHPWVILGTTLIITIFFGMQFPTMVIDTDPENMLPADEPIRMFHAETRDNFNLHDFIAVGVVAEPTAFTADLVNRVYQITAEIEKIEGVIAEDILAPSTVDDIRQDSGGVLTIKPLVAEEIRTDEEALYVLGRIKANPVLRGKLASDDGQVIALFIPIESKDMSHAIASQIRAITDRLGGGAEIHIAGLPLAEDSFGGEMFVQMAYSAPMAMLIIFLLLFLFFRQLRLIMAPMAVAMVSVIWAMGLLILTGNPVHIMSSMIPIFLIPIAVLDSIHIISEFQENAARTGDSATAMRQTISELFMPMLFTSLTTVAGFASLALTPIPPVQVFGIFVAFGIGVAFVLSLVIHPAVVALIPETAIKRFGSNVSTVGILSSVMAHFRVASTRHYRLIVIVAAIIIPVAGYGLSLIVVNDNPVNWFKSSHPIRVADRVMNDHLAGTYMNYLVFEAGEPDAIKSPAVMQYIQSLQREIEKEAVVGATVGVSDIVKKVRFELFGADSTKFALPETRDEIAQMLFLFEMSGGDPDDLFKLVTPDYEAANLWVQLKDGDNQTVSRVVARATDFISANPPPDDVEIHWAGLPFINIAWQQKMVAGMGYSLLGAYGVVLIMMMLLFRSVRWSLISLLPLTITIMAIYAFIGYIGKPYDMPVAVLSSLTLGLSIDFAIHFIQRLRTIHKRCGDFNQSFNEIFESTGRAIGRNVLVIAIGFVPMLFSSLSPYITVGAFFLAIMIVSGVTTMLLLPSVVTMFNKRLLPSTEKDQ